MRERQNVLTRRQVIDSALAVALGSVGYGLWYCGKQIEKELSGGCVVDNKVELDKVGLLDEQSIIDEINARIKRGGVIDNAEPLMVASILYNAYIFNGLNQNESLARLRYAVLGEHSSSFCDSETRRLIGIVFERPFSNQRALHMYTNKLEEVAKISNSQDEYWEHLIGYVGHEASHHAVRSRRGPITESYGVLGNIVTDKNEDFFGFQNHGTPQGSDIAYRMVNRMTKDSQHQVITIPLEETAAVIGQLSYIQSLARKGLNLRPDVLTNPSALFCACTYDSFVPALVQKVFSNDPTLQLSFALIPDVIKRYHIQADRAGLYTVLGYGVLSHNNILYKDDFSDGDIRAIGALLFSALIRERQDGVGTIERLYDEQYSQQGLLDIAEKHMEYIDEKGI